MDDRKHKGFFQSGAHGDSVQILQLSLFIMLLAFFIVLNATSNFEENKVVPVIQSLYRAFSTDLSPTTSDLIPQRLITTTLKRNQAVNIFADIFKADLPNISEEMTIDEDRGVLTIPFSAQEFEDSIFNKNPITLDRIIASMIYLEENKESYSIEIAVRVEKGDSLKDMSVLIARQENYASQLARKGIREKFLSFSFSETVDDEVIMVFRPYKPYAPKPKRGSDE